MPIMFNKHLINNILFTLFWKFWLDNNGIYSTSDRVFESFHD